MLRLNLTDDATEVLQLPGDATLTCKAATTALIYGTRDVLVAEATANADPVDEDELDEVVNLPTLDWIKAVARAAVVDWTGVGDQDGEPIVCTPDGVDALLEIPAVYRVFTEKYFNKALATEQEGNA